MRLTRSPGRPLKSVLTQGGWSSGAMSCKAIHMVGLGDLLNFAISQEQGSCANQPSRPRAPQCRPESCFHRSACYFRCLFTNRTSSCGCSMSGLGCG